MHLTLPKQKTLIEQIRPAMIAAALVALGIVFIPVHYPVQVTNGTITPNVGRPADKAEVRWTQEWRDLCPVTITREFVGADGFRITAAPYDYEPPKSKGSFPYVGPLVLPNLPAGPAYYHSVIQPHCWIDRIWQRTYRTPEITLTMIGSTPSGPR